MFQLHCLYFFCNLKLLYYDILAWLVAVSLATPCTYIIYKEKTILHLSVATRQNLNEMLFSFMHVKPRMLLNQ